MITEVKATRLGSIGKINVQVGSKIAAGQELLTMETKKGNAVIKATCNGIVESIEVEEGMEVKVAQVLLKVREVQEENNSSKNEEKIKPVEKIESEITVIGGGPGGYVAAIKASKMGAKVVLVEKEFLGGTCLNCGCIPTKALVRSAEVYDSIREADAFGITAKEFKVDMAKVIERKNSIVSRLVQGIEYLMDKNSIKVIKGNGKFLDKNTVEAETEDKKIQIHSKNVILATGSETVYLPIPGAKSKNVLTSKEILDLKELPESLAIIGGGVIGMEFAFIFASFGVKVSVVEFLDNILQMLDQDVIHEITAAAKKKGITLYTGSKVEEIIDTEDNKSILKFTKNGEAKYISIHKVLMAVGRKPYLDNLSLENAGVELNDNKKGIKVSLKMNTNVSNIYAIGDATNIIQLAHVASHQGLVAVENIMGKDMEMDYSAVPSAIFTHPEIATVGLTEKIAKEKGLNIEIGKFPYAANGKALTMGDERGFIKIIKDKATRKIVGASIIGINSADLISPLTIAIRNGLTTEQIIETIFAHPTTAEVIHEGVLSVEGGALHFAE
ncbi:dihydrolipoyl dehydrogenase [Clostridium homopropionicum DSM 5847]|uniref:Dihydrolipoyl dehydrogenase n=1 Tax=Clostridium homopropionicum DSM 5847 TaxID=1121318 RepID=A0A0L6ZEX2_9CLOT|nr:dihydrolipoyl dehydrogenase [Clostridium homopropionicum]KOA21539.1 dihydrolipoyl dehydrogenase [Clostridium homopropionicum DSM 5847]SFG06464.1 dihydrolipoamide dehydrogenase [Clostridium homopropionicum]